MTAVEDTALKESVLALLSSSAVSRINFVAEDVRISSAGYSKLKNLVLSGRLRVTVDPRLKTPGEYQALNADFESANILKVSGLPLSAPLVVHELTHALIDDLELPARRGLSRTEDEAIAFIAQCVYKRLTHEPLAPATDRKQLHLARVADAVAGKVVASGHHVYHVTEDEMRSLRNAVGQHPRYIRFRDMHAPSDGIPRRPILSCLELNDSY